MAKQANRMMIGVFVVIAVFIMAASLVVFGSGRFFKQTVKCAMYFDGSVKGLNVGAPVLFQGVPIGSVTNIILEVDPAMMQLSIPVLVEYEPEKFHVVSGGQHVQRDPRKTIPKLIEKGLRAQLGMQSFITGQLDIEIGFYPDANLCYAPAKVDKVYKDYIVIPTCKSTTQKLADALEKLDLAQLEQHLESAMDGIAKLANNPDLAASIKSLKATLQGADATLKDARKLVTKVDRQVEPLAKDTKKTVNDIGKLANNLDDRVGGLTTGLDKTLATARNSISQDSPLMVDLQNTLQELSRMSRSLRQLADYLDQHPESLIRGKKKPGGK
jgi:paraquat-inducible protein B